MEGGGWLWLLIALGMVLLGVAIAYASAMWRHRRKDPLARERTEERTREIYRRGG